MHLILANFDQADNDRALKRLTDGQLARLATIRSQKAQNQFIWSRVLYNGLIRRLTGAMPTFELIPHQPHPTIRHGDLTYYSSISHTGNWVAVAFDTSPVAIDLETMKSREWQKLSEFAFPTEACRWIESSTSPQDAFYIVWGQRECEIKMQTWKREKNLFRANKITTKPHDLMLTCLCDPKSDWQPQILPITLLENF